MLDAESSISMPERLDDESRETQALIYLYELFQR